MQDFSGKAITIETMEAPSILASGFLFATKNVIPVDIVSTDKSAVLYIERDGIIWLCREYEVFSEKPAERHGGQTHHTG